jgi:sulfate adenylyltransferase subunit 1 (EFTu-like GTPase family)
MPWYRGQSLLEHLEDVEVNGEETGPARFPVQWIINADADDAFDKSHFRGYAGQIMSGRFDVGDEVMVLPAGQRTRIKSIHTFDGQLEEAAAPLSVTMLLDDDLDVGRGDMLVHEHSAPLVQSALEAVVCWMDEQPLRAGRLYSIKQSARRTRIKVTAVQSKLNINTLESVASPDQMLGLNDIGVISFTAATPLVFDSYSQSRSTGSFILVDESTNATAGAGLLLDPALRKSDLAPALTEEATV